METRKELIYDKINTGMKYNAEFMHAGIEKQQVLSVCHFRSKDNGALRYQNKWIVYLSCYSVFLCSIRPISVCIVRVSWCFSLNLWLAILNFLQSKRIEHFLSLNTRITSSEDSQGFWVSLILLVALSPSAGLDVRESAAIGDVGAEETEETKYIIR